MRTLEMRKRRGRAWHLRVCWPRLRILFSAARRVGLCEGCLAHCLLASLLMSAKLIRSNGVCPCSDRRPLPINIGGHARRPFYDDDQRLQWDIPANALPQSERKTPHPFPCREHGGDNQEIVAPGTLVGTAMSAGFALRVRRRPVVPAQYSSSVPHGDLDNGHKW